MHLFNYYVTRELAIIYVVIIKSIIKTILDLLMVYDYNAQHAILHYTIIIYSILILYGSAQPM